jgi:hypothetical protein
LDKARRQSEQQGAGDGQTFSEDLKEPAGGPGLWFMKRGLMIATRVKNRENHEVGISEQPLFGFGTGSFRSAGDCAQMLISREAAKMIQAYARQGRYFVFGEDLLARLDAYHTRPLML